MDLNIVPDPPNHLPFHQKQATVPTRVVLHNVGFNSSGHYRCEVSAEAPNFNTVNCRGSLMVVGKWRRRKGRDKVA